MPSPVASDSAAPFANPEIPLGDPQTVAAQPATEPMGTADGHGGEGPSAPAETEIKNSPPSGSVLELMQNAVTAQAAAGASSTAPPVNGTNGTIPGRKRSRSGSVICSPPPEQSQSRVRETPQDKIQLEQYVYREFQHNALEASRRFDTNDIVHQKRAEREYWLALRREAQMNPAALYGVGYQGFGNARTDLKNQQPQLIYPTNRRRPGGRRTRELRISRKDMKIQNELKEDLVPIRIDCDWDKVKIRDTFTWNLHDRVTSPDLFAEKLVEDLGLIPETCVPLVKQISHSIQEQLTDYYPHVYMEEDPLDPHLPYDAYKNDEMRILIKLNITIGQHTLVDQFEWDLNNPYNSPEEFAIQMTQDLSLSGEFTTAIAHSIREQAQLFTRSLYITAHPFDGRPVEDPDLKSAFLPSPMPSAFRPYQAAKEFTPYLYELNEAELERTEVSISREQRRQKRSVNRRGGPALPDLKDRQRTIRTMIVSSVIPNSASSIEEAHLFKRSGTGRGRRAAAGGRDGVDDSDLSDSDDSSASSPAIGVHLQQGTARTRGMRGAASAAQAAMRSNLAQSATPEPSHETRGRRRDYREESSEEPDKLVVRLRINPARFRQFLQELQSRKQNPQGTTAATTAPTATSTAPASATGVGRPASVSKSPAPAQQIGAVEAPHPPQAGQQGVSYF